MVDKATVKIPSQRESMERALGKSGQLTALLPQIHRDNVDFFEKVPYFFDSPAELAWFVCAVNDRAILLYEGQEEKSTRTYGFSYSRKRPVSAFTSTAYLDTFRVLLQSRGYSKDFSNTIIQRANYFLWEENFIYYVDTPLSFNVLNEFLAQDEIQTYGAYLESNWEKLYENSLLFKFNEYPWSVPLYRGIMARNYLTLRPSMSKSARTILENLTKSEIAALVASNDFAVECSNSNVENFLLNALSKLRGDVEYSVSPLELMNFSCQILAASVIKETSSVDLRMALQLYGELTIDSSQHLTGSSAEKTASKIYTGELKLYLDALQEHVNELNFVEVLFLLLMWDTPKLFSRSASSRLDFLKFFSEAQESFAGDTQQLVDFLKLLAYGAFAYPHELPSIAQWREALKKGNLRSIMIPELTLELITDSTKPTSIPVSMKNLRQVLIKGT